MQLTELDAYAQSHHGLVVKSAGLIAVTLALVLGSGIAAVVAFGISVSVLAGFFVTVQPKSDALHDRLAGTTIAR